ncbi:MAG TPA: tetratricopeptide repeat protein [Planctomycetota bacterium]|nr:tetratricopeptide repeat protein [Planctomycetota bacterium]HRR83301.1 tetratricopeptide repeat protein [Planctomycetota bacterium]HRT96775.1 tetratricopeptide repeat protein [Planctomycetota bacterium]
MRKAWFNLLHRRACGPLAAIVLLVAPPCLAGARPARPQGEPPSAEVQLSNEEVKTLDTFEGHALTKADKVFDSRDFPRAAAEYDSFLLEFPKSKAIPYALVRKARALHLALKRHEAIKAYNEVLDYFPNAVKYAAPALFNIGLCHWENGDEEDAMRIWAKMAADDAYSKHPLAASALTHLAEHLAKEGQAERAAATWRQIAVNFRTQNPQAANNAIQQVIAFYIRTQPDEAKLRAFYREVAGFGEKPERLEADLDSSRRYWGHVLQGVRLHGRFDNAQADLRDRYYRTWAAALDGRFADWDHYQIELANFKLAFERDPAQWIARLDAQFERGQKPGDYARIVRWIALFAQHKAKVMDYYGKLAFEKMANADIRELMRILYERANEAKLARNLVSKLRLGEMPDSEKADLARYLAAREPDLVKDICLSFDDKELGQMELLRFHHGRKDAALGVPIADQLLRSARFAKEALWLKGQLLHATKQYPQAIAVYQQCDNPPDNLWAIADCYAKQDKLDQAVAQLREVEAFFKAHAPEAALRIANLYREAGKTPQHIAALRMVLKKYPESAQSSAAHHELERLGVKMGGGLDAQ